VTAAAVRSRRPAAPLLHSGDIRAAGQGSPARYLSDTTAELAGPVPQAPKPKRTAGRKPPPVRSVAARRPLAYLGRKSERARGWHRYRDAYLSHNRTRNARPQVLKATTARQAKAAAILVTLGSGGEEQSVREQNMLLQ